MTIEEAARGLILGDPSRLLPHAGAPIEVSEVVVHPVIARRGDRQHRPVSVRYTAGGRSGSIELWLKSRPGLAALFPMLEAYSERLGDQIFPRPLYAWRSDTDHASFIITERVDGEPLRDRLMKAALLGRTGRLAPVFRANGAKMRAFHDAFEPTGSTPVGSLVADTQTLVSRSDHPTAIEKASIVTHIERHAGAFATPTDLPVRKIHHDWILRNIVVDEKGRDFVVVCDSMRAVDNLRWYDVGYLLINLESQMKWSPLLTRRRLAPLWQAFWGGYRAAGPAIDGLAEEQIAALLYLIRLQYLLGGTIRVPLYRMFEGAVGGRYVRALTAGLVAGQPALFDSAFALTRGSPRSPE